MNEPKSQGGLAPSSDDDLFIMELDARLELSIPVVDSDLDGDYNTAGCSNTSACSAENGMSCSNSARCS